MTWGFIATIISTVLPLWEAKVRRRPFRMP